MLKINRINFEINTSSGLFGNTYDFDDSLNIVRADNTSGKSSLFQAITYCLGFEEIIGGRNEKTMQSVFRDQVEYPKDIFHKVIQSFVYLEIENSNRERITIKRSVISNSDRKPQLVDVYFGSVIHSDNVLESQPMYIHDKGGASDETYGFHYFLETFLGWNLPNVMNNTGDQRKLYIQQIASAFLIEQKSGWSDFFATMPHYSMPNKEARTVEFILNLDVSENKKRKLQVNYNKRLIEEEWSLLNTQFIKLSEKGAGKIVGLESKPYIINDLSKINIVLSKDEEDYTIPQYISLQVDELSLIEGKSISLTAANIEKNEALLEQLNNYINKLSLNYERLGTELNLDNEKLRSYRSQRDFLKSDLDKIRVHLKLKV